MDSENIEFNEESGFYKGLQNFAIGFHEVLLELGKALVPIATTIQDALKNIDPDKLKKFLENVEKFQKNEPYLTKLINELKGNDNLLHVNETLSLACFVQLIYENEDNPDDVDLLDIINTTYFNKMFFSQFNSIKIEGNFRKRECVLREAFLLYELKLYAGCLSILYGQLEGILTDYLVHKEVLKRDEGKYTYLGDDIQGAYSVKKNKKITGISEKIIIAKNIDEYFGKLDAYKIDSTYKINQDRNDILHGNILDRFTKERCFILVIWLVSIFSYLQKENLYTQSLDEK